MKDFSNRISSFDLLRALSMLFIIGVWHIDDYANQIFKSPITYTMKISALSIFVYMSAFLLSKNTNI